MSIEGLCNIAEKLAIGFFVYAFIYTVYVWWKTKDSHIEIQAAILEAAYLEKNKENQR